jgi:hypothetical protein
MESGEMSGFRTCGLEKVVQVRRVRNQFVQYFARKVCARWILPLQALAVVIPRFCKAGVDRDRSGRVTRVSMAYVRQLEQYRSCGRISCRGGTDEIDGFDVALRQVGLHTPTGFLPVSCSRYPPHPPLPLSLS